DTLVGFGDVHRSAFAAARADGSPHHLAVDLFQRNAFADEVMQPAVCGHQLVVVAKRDAHCRCDRLLPARGPVHAHELTGADALRQPIVGRLHQHHQRVNATAHLVGWRHFVYVPISRYTFGIGGVAMSSSSNDDILPLAPSSPNLPTTASRSSQSSS